MSELKATTAQEIVQNEKDCDYMDELFGGVKMPHTQVYLKSEADKVIAELKDELQAANEQIENLINSASSIMLFQDKVNDNKCAELRHHKYKRCLAMVMYCHESAMWLEENGVNKSAAFMLRWEKRWLELAEKFKEAK